MRAIKVKELEVGIATEYGLVAEMVHVSDVEIIVNIVEDFFENEYEAYDDSTFEQYEFNPDDTILID